MISAELLRDPPSVWFARAVSFSRFPFFRFFGVSLSRESEGKFTGSVELSPSETNK